MAAFCFDPADVQSLLEITCSIVWILICTIFNNKPKLSCVLFGSEVLMPHYAGRVCGAFNKLLVPGARKLAVFKHRANVKFPAMSRGSGSLGFN